MRVAITGAAGLLGSAVLQRLRNAQHEVIALSSSKREITEAELVPWDATQNWRRTAEALRRVDVVIHSAAYIPRDNSDATEAARCLEVNALGTLQLLLAAKQAMVRRFIYVSGANILRPRSDSIQEDDPLGCEHAPYYLGSKALGELYVRAEFARGLDGLIVRPSSIYGPGARTGVIWAIANNLRANIPVCLHDGGQFRADYVWRDDVAEVLCDAVTGSHRGVVNLGSGKSYTVIEVAKILCEILHADQKLIKLEAPSRQNVALGFLAVDISRAREWFGFEPTELSLGLRRWFSEDRC